MKLADYFCENCGSMHEEIFRDTETQPEILDQVCEKCGGSLRRGLNLKNNCQRDHWND